MECRRRILRASRCHDSENKLFLTQKANGIKDSGEMILADTLKGGAKKPEIAKVTATRAGCSRAASALFRVCI